MMPWLPRTTLDPVCGAALDEKTTTLKIEYAGRTYFFCSPRCMEKFISEPTMHIKGPASFKPKQST